MKITVVLTATQVENIIKDWVVKEDLIPGELDVNQIDIKEGGETVIIIGAPAVPLGVFGSDEEDEHNMG